MKSKKLSITEREDLTDSLVASAFKKEDEKILKTINDFGGELYDAFVMPYYSALKMLEKVATHKGNDFRVRDNTTYRHIYPRLKEKKIFLDSNDLIPELDAKKHKKEYNKLQKIFQTQDKLKEERRQTKSKTRAALNSISTTKQLSEIWPEAFEEYKALFPETATFLPDVRRDDLNKLLKIKKIKEPKP